MKPRLSRSLQRILAGVVVCSQLAQAESLNWNGTADSHTWNTVDTNTVWKDSADQAASFSSNDNVTFGVPSSGDVSTTVTVDSDLVAGTVTVDGDYVIETAAPGSITGEFAGTGALTKSGQDELTLDAAQGTSGPALAVKEGDLTLAGSGSFNSLSSMAEETGLTIASGAEITFAGAADGSHVTPLGTLILNGDSQFTSVEGSGKLVLAEGKTLQIASSAYLGSLQSSGSITAGNTFILDNAVEQGGTLSAPTIILNNGGVFTGISADSLILASAPSKTAAIVTTETIGGRDASAPKMEIQVEKIVRGSGDYALVAASDLGGTAYTLNEYTTRHYLDYGYIATLASDANGLTLHLETTDSGYFVRHTTSRNGHAGGRLLDAAFAQLDPQANAVRYSDLAGVMTTMDAYIDAGNVGAADALAASVAGPGVTALNTAFRSQMERQLREIRNRLTTMNGGMPCDPPDPKAPAPKQLRYTLWANAEIDYQNLRGDSSGPGFKLNSLGGTAGFTALAGKDLTLGAAFTGMAGRLSSKGYGSSASGDLDAYYANVFGRYDSGCWSHSLIGTVGFADASFNRYVAYQNGSYTANGSTDGLGFGVMYEVARTFRISQDYMASAWWQPVFNVSYIHSQIDSYTESGSDAALQVGKQESDNVIFGLGARMQTVVAQNFFNSPALMELRVLGKAIAGTRRGDADVSILGVDRTTRVYGAEPGAFGVELGIGFSIPLGERYGAIITDCTAEFANDQNSVNGILGYRIDF